MITLDHTIAKSGEQTSLGQLHSIDGKLYGRDAHLRRLMNAFNKKGSSAGSKVVFISGNSGAGKSALVERAKENILKERNVHFISGKFDQLQHAEPLSAIGAALS
eukprot:6923371-Ditylum_brightwellii.AAC.1